RVVEHGGFAGVDTIAMELAPEHIKSSRLDILPTCVVYDPDVALDVERSGREEMLERLAVAVEAKLVRDDRAAERIDVRRRWGVRVSEGLGGRILLFRGSLAERRVPRVS